MTISPDAYARTQAATNIFLDRLVGSRPDDATMAELVVHLDEWADRLGAFAVAEEECYAGRRLDLPAKGRFTVPVYMFDSVDEHGVAATVTFGRRFLGVGAAAHGGAIAMLFDEVVGRAVNDGSALRTRTAYLHVNYRALTPIDKPLTLTVRVAASEGRKRFVRGELKDGSIVCADVDALLVEVSK
ncbi:MAG: hypothetical protein B7Y45_14065 [Sphingomonas sp. 28-66-16]|nr:MAG: hypothetical protein B7Y45_14065 [Sphingomonas sp. 28-66-16]